jgi:hypothetical protein
MVEPGALAGDGHRASGAGAEWAGGGARADLALGWRREEARARLVSGARAEWGGSGGAHADLALGHRREEAGTHSFFFFALLGCTVEEREACGRAVLRFYSSVGPYFRLQKLL